MLVDSHWTLNLLNEFKDLPHQDNCLLLVNEIRKHFLCESLDSFLIKNALNIDHTDCHFILRLLTTYATELSLSDIDALDLVVMHFSNQVCLGTYIFDYIFFLGNQGVICKPIEIVGSYVVSAWRVKNNL
jgi:hypothetical protein